jgi:hypothetical protein
MWLTAGNVCCITLGELLVSVVVGKDGKPAFEHKKDLCAGMLVARGAVPRRLDKVLNSDVILTAKTHAFSALFRLIISASLK